MRPSARSLATRARAPPPQQLSPERKADKQAAKCSELAHTHTHTLAWCSKAHPWCANKKPYTRGASPESRARLNVTCAQALKIVRALARARALDFAHAPGSMHAACEQRLDVDLIWLTGCAGESVGWYKYVTARCVYLSSHTSWCWLCMRARARDDDRLLHCAQTRNASFATVWIRIHYMTAACLREFARACVRACVRASRRRTQAPASSIAPRRRLH